MRDFFKYVFASFVGIILFLAVGLGGLIFLVAIAASFAEETETAVKEKSILVYDLTSPVRDTPPDESPGRILSNALAGGEESRPIALRDAIRAIRAAAEDDNIVGLYLQGDIGTGTTSLAVLSELRQALAEFRKSEKPILAYDTLWTEQDYYLSSMANTIALNPAGVVEMNGFRSETSFFAEALQRLGVGIQITRAGNYKSAVEPLIQNSRSPADRQQTQKLLSDLWGDYLRTVSADRKLTTQQLQQIVDTQAVLLPNEAKTAKLIDRTAHVDEMTTELKKLTGQEQAKASEDLRRVSLEEYIGFTRDEEATSSNKIALVYAEGDIVSGQGEDGSIGGDRLAARLRDLREDEDIKAVVIRINTPGGSALASDKVTREVKLTREVKPVVVSMGTVAASGGYQIATYANKIFALPNTITGSIGVFGVIPNVQQLANRNGVTWDVVKTGRFADFDTIARPKTPEEMAIAQRSVDQFYSSFVNMVAEARKLPREKVAEIAQGRVWSGITAKQLGLVDELGGLDAAIAESAKLAELGDDWTVEDYPADRSLEERFFEGIFSRQVNPTTSSNDPISQILQQFQDEVKTLRSLNDPFGAYARLPFAISID